MAAFFDSWSPGQFLALVATVAGSVSLVILILTVYGYNLRALADATALRREQLNAEMSLKRELIQRGRPPLELEHAIKLLKLDEPPPAPNTPDPFGDWGEAEFAKRAASLEKITPEDLEEVIALVRAVDGPRKRAALSVLAALADQGVEGPVAVAAIRSLFRSTERPNGDAVPQELESHVTRR
jgi:hypothetical protein